MLMRLWRRYLREFRKAFPPGRLNDVGGIIGAGASIIGGLMGADASEDAAGIQAGASRYAADIQKAMFDQTRADLEPWRRAGGVALNRITDLLGLDVPRAPVDAAGVPLGADAATIRQRLLPQFTTRTFAGPESFTGETAREILNQRLHALENPTLTVDETGLNAAVQAELARVAAAQAPPSTERPTDFGALMRDFTLGDLVNDPIYALTKDFQLEEGRNILTNAASARGETDSGVLMKDLMKYGTNILNLLGTQAFDRYNTNRTMKYNFLAPTANLGQATGVQLGQLGANAANAMGGYITGGANAQAAGIVGGANAMSGGISGALQAYQNQELLRRFLPQTGGGGGSAPTPSYTSGYYGLQPPGGGAMALYPDYAAE